MRVFMYCHSYIRKTEDFQTRCLCVLGLEILMCYPVLKEATDNYWHTLLETGLHGHSISVCIYKELFFFNANSTWEYNFLKPVQICCAPSAFVFLVVP